MQKQYIQYLKSLLKYAGFIVLLLMLGYWLFKGIISSQTAAVFLFFILVNTGFHYLLLQLTYGKTAEAFVNSYLLFMGYKFLTYLIGAAVFVFTLHPPALPFAIQFFIIYLLFAVFEIRYLVKYNINREQQ